MLRAVVIFKVKASNSTVRTNSTLLLKKCIHDLKIFLTQYLISITFYFRNEFIKIIIILNSGRIISHNIFYLLSAFANAKSFLYRLILPKDSNDLYISSPKLAVPLSLLLNASMITLRAIHCRVAKRE